MAVSKAELEVEEDDEDEESNALLPIVSSNVGSRVPPKEALGEPTLLESLVAPFMT